MKTSKNKKIKPQSIARALAFQALYQEELNPRFTEIDWQELLDDYCAETQTIIPNIDNAEVIRFARRLFDGVVDNKVRIDEILNKSLDKRTLKQTTVVDRNILRVATYEIVTIETAKAIVISEALELGKKFGDNGSRAFLNGVLDQVDKTSQVKPVSFKILPTESHDLNTKVVDSESNV